MIEVLLKWQCLGWEQHTSTFSHYNKLMLVIKFFDLCSALKPTNMEYGNIGYETGKKCNFTGLKFKLYSNANDLYLQGKYVTST